MQIETQAAGYRPSAGWDISRAGTTALVRLTGEIDLAVTSGPPGGLLGVLEAGTSGAATVTCDLSDVRFMDSSGIHLLLKLREAVASTDRRFIIARPSTAVRRVFELTAAGKMFEIVE
jgi:anti-anti-sigma factor